MQAQFSEVLIDRGFNFIGMVGQKNAFTINNEGKLVLTDEFGLAWEILEQELSDEQKCELCGRRRYVAHLFAVQTLH